MSSIEESLIEGERLVAFAKIHWWHTAQSYLALIVPLLVLIAVFVFLRDADRDAVMWETITLLLMGAGLFVYRTVYLGGTEIAVTSRRLINRAGLFSPREGELALRDIGAVDVSRSKLGRYLGYGSLRISSRGMKVFEAPCLADPEGFRRAIETASANAGYASVKK